jgi:protease-4
VVVKGTIVGGEGGGAQGLAGADSVVRQVRAAAEDDDVRAIVVRVESGGGDVTASEAMWQALSEARRKKPVVCSMGDIAASGGYYVAVAADEIVAEPSTLTGSIGVFAGKADLSALLAKIGVTSQVFRRGDRSDMFTLLRPWSEGEHAAVRGLVARYYETFLRRVAAGRKMTRDEVDQVARGRVWTGAQARERRLVDELGGLDLALSRARARAGLDADVPVTVPGAGGLFEFPDAAPQVPVEALDGATGDLQPGPLSGPLSGPFGAVAGGLLAGLVPDAAERVAARRALELLARAGGLGGDAVASLDALLPLLDGRPLALALDLPVVR